MAFSQRLGHDFAKPEILIRAVTHSSMVSPHRDDNQRLEFLGDRVLGLVMAEALLKADPSAPEGLLAPRYNAMVRREACADVARQIDLGTVLKLGRSEMKSGGRRKEALLADAMEALKGMGYLVLGLDGEAEQDRETKLHKGRRASRWFARATHALSSTP